MIKCELTEAGNNHITFQGDVETLEKDITQIMWSMIQKSSETRAALIRAIDNINTAVSEMGEKK